MSTPQAANDTPATQPADLWGVARRGDAQVTMRGVLNGLMGAPFSGVDLADGELALAQEFEDAVAACRHFEYALVAEMQRMGAGVRKLAQGETPEEVNVTDWDGLFICKWEDEPALTSMYMETVGIVGSCSGNVSEAAGKVACGIVEAVAEMMRVLLAGAVVAAFQDGAAEDDVVVVFHAGPEIASRVDVRDGAASALIRVRGAVYNRCGVGMRSYLLGESAERCSAEEKKPLQFLWAFPLVEQVYGPDRLRWKDKRSAPSYVAQQAKLVVAS